MMKRLGDLEYLTGCGYVEGNTKIKSDTDHITKRFKDLEQFLQFEYNYKHIKLDSPSKCHCYRFALNKTTSQIVNPCSHDHNQIICKSCLELHLLFQTMKHLLQYVQSQLTGDNDKVDIHKEIISMEKAVTDIFEPTVKSYMAHRVRAVANFDKLRNETASFTDNNVIYG